MLRLTPRSETGYAWHNDFCFPGQDRLAKDIGVSRQSVNTHVKELERKGVISIKRLGQGRANLYELNLKAKVLKRLGGIRCQIF